MYSVEIESSEVIECLLPEPHLSAPGCISCYNTPESPKYEWSKLQPLKIKFCESEQYLVVDHKSVITGSMLWG